MSATIGVLAVQGDFREHRAALEELGASVVEVRLPEHLEGLDGIVLPGGESTAIARLIELYSLAEPLAAFRGAMLGTCAGMILLAGDVQDGVPGQRSLGRLDIAVQRNGYGRQVQSFEAPVELGGGAEPLHGVFIRAPRVVSVGEAVEVVGTLDGEPVIVKQGNVIAAACHPELTADRRIHRLLLEQTSPRRDEQLAPA